MPNPEPLTRYDWLPGQRAWILNPAGDKNPRHQIVCLRHQVLLELLEQGRLVGQAAEDAARLARGEAAA